MAPSPGLSCSRAPPASSIAPTPIRLTHAAASLRKRNVSVRHDETHETCFIPACPPLLGSGLHMHDACSAHLSTIVHEKLDYKRLIRLLIHVTSSAQPQIEGELDRLAPRPVRAPKRSMSPKVLSRLLARAAQRQRTSGPTGGDTSTYRCDHSGRLRWHTHNSGESRGASS
jgi:hypothetical protein